MKSLIFIFAFLFLAASGAIAQQRKFFIFPSDSLKSLPQFEHKKIDTLGYYIPGDTIPNELWENYLKSQKNGKNKSFATPMDNMPVIVPPKHAFSLIVVKPDSKVHYHLRNFGAESIMTPAK